MNAAYTQHHGTYLAHRISLEGRGEDAFAKSLSTARVETKPHQVDAALFALHSPLSKGVILADEVGLGKTIEASLVIAQCWAERRRRILLVVPASLRKQWQQELREKFTLSSRIMEAHTWNAAKKTGQARPFDAAAEIILTSYEFAARRADDVRAVKWDLVVFDEAHRLRNVYKKSGSARAKALKDAVRDSFKILLTATPLQNSLMELYGLVSIIDEQFFGDERSFKIMYEGRQTDKLTLTSLRRRMAPIYKRHLRRDVQEAGHVSFTRRMATTFDFEPSDKEAELYEKVSAYLQRPDSIAFGLRPNQLVIIQARKILGSSVAAISGFLQTVLERLRRHEVADASTVEDVGDATELAEELQETDTLDAGADDADGAATDDQQGPEIDPEALKDEIAELETYIGLAAAIGPNAKGEKLVARLPEVMDEVVRRNGQRKAVIFTESVRTQTYLSNLLTRNGYDGQVVLLNGSNSDPGSQALYKTWHEKHKGTDAISGSKSSDMKAAIVEAFKGAGKSILIATESGAEGINLQFCSIVLNFDLPWNPQRVEQRIGRCHRYGQKIDVTVVNMLNRRNRAEQRVYELLESKFQLFSGVFGASDGVLGAIESGIDFERKVVEAVQRGRTEAQVEEEFRRIEDELEARIAADMTEARRKIFDSLDRDVVARLRQRGSEIQGTLDVFAQRLLTVAKAELPDAKFHAPNGPRFDFEGKTWTTEWPLADEKGWQFFRLAEATLAEKIVAAARDRVMDWADLTFDYAAYRAAGWPKIANVERFAGQSGWASVSRLSIQSAAAEMGKRECLVVAGFADGAPGAVIDQEVVDDFFLLPALVATLSANLPIGQMQSLESDAEAAVMARVEDENRKWLDEETEKLDAYSEDLQQSAELRIKALEAEVKAAKKALRMNSAISLTDKVQEQRRIKTLDAEVDELKMTTFERKKAIRAEIDQKLDAIANVLQAVQLVTAIFTFRWTVRV
jgi:superfamily II DNA or RNA helicase